MLLSNVIQRLLETIRIDKASADEWQSHPSWQLWQTAGKKGWQNPKITDREGGMTFMMRGMVGPTKEKKQQKVRNRSKGKNKIEKKKRWLGLHSDSYSGQKIWLMFIPKQLQETILHGRCEAPWIGKIWVCVFAQPKVQLSPHLFTHTLVWTQKGAGSCLCRADIQPWAGHASLACFPLHHPRMGRA